MEQQTTFIPDGMNAFERNVKRIGDCIIAGILLIIFSPLFCKPPIKYPYKKESL